MIAAARRQRTEPAPRRDPIAFLLFYRMDWTDANPWFGLVGAALTILLAGVAGEMLP